MAQLPDVDARISWGANNVRLQLLITLIATTNAVSAFAEDQIISIDFGARQLRAGGDWNNLTEPKRTGLLLTNAQDANGRETTVRLRQLDAWAGFNTTGDQRDKPLPVAAKRDSFYLERGVDTKAKLQIEGLKPGATFNITIFASRMGSDETRIGVYAIGDQRLELDAANNKEQTIAFRGVAADDRGAIQLVVECAEQSKYAYLGAMQIVGSFGLAADHKEPPDSLDGPPIVSAKAWAIGDGKTGKLLWGGNQQVSRNMASTTKIMTAWIVLELAREEKEVLQEIVTVSQTADNTGGSTAKLNAGEQLAVSDLLYGLLLPSGNDAAVALGEHFGRRFGNDKDTVPANKLADEQSLAQFVVEMNRRAKRLGMQETRYLDPHGNSANRSSARDLLRLGWTSMQNGLFRKYVQTRRHRCTVTTSDETQREAIWKNSNQLLNIEGYNGVKTGTTGGAGACLVSSGIRGKDHLLVVVLGATSRDGRYVDSRNLYRWAWTRRGHN